MCRGMMIGATDAPLRWLPDQALSIDLPGAS